MPTASSPSSRMSGSKRPLTLMSAPKISAMIVSVLLLGQPADGGRATARLRFARSAARQQGERGKCDDLSQRFTAPCVVSWAVLVLSVGWMMKAGIASRRKAVEIAVHLPVFASG